jgi:serine/threonine-protein kinase RsbW
MLLPECPARDDVIYVSTELASNAVRHTASGRGGRFVIEIIQRAAVVRVSVRDAGAPSVPRIVGDDPLQESGRGLLLVDRLSLRHGVAGDERGRLAWADIPWPDQGNELHGLWAGTAHDDHAALTPRHVTHASHPP